MPKASPTAKAQIGSRPMLTKAQVVQMCKKLDLTKLDDVNKLHDALIERSEALPPGKQEIETLLCSAVSTVHSYVHRLIDAVDRERDEVADFLDVVGSFKDPPSKSFDPVLRSRSVEYAAGLLEAYKNFRRVLVVYKAMAAAKTS